MASFGERLRDLRLKAGLSQEEEAARLGVSPQAVSKWETDKCYPEFSLILPLARRQVKHCRQRRPRRFNILIHQNRPRFLCPHKSGG